MVCGYLKLRGWTLSISSYRNGIWVSQGISSYGVGISVSQGISSYGKFLEVAGSYDIRLREVTGDSRQEDLPYKML